MPESRRRAGRKAAPAASAKAPRRARVEEIVADGSYRDEDVLVPTRRGELVAWRVHARELPWEEQSAISDRHTKVIQVGRSEERRNVDQTSIMREILDRMIKGDKCDPPIAQEEIRKLRGATLQAFAEHFNLNAEARQEDEKKAGESDAP